LEPEALFGKLQANVQGLSKKEAAVRLKRYGRNIFNAHKESSTLSLLFSQFKSPLVFLLIFAALLSYVFYERVDSVIILTIIVASALLGFFQEKKATNAMQKLLALVKTKAMVLRDGKEFEIPIEKVVPGDILIFNAGDQISADGLILESKDFFVDESSLTGEPFAIEKREGKVAGLAPLNQRNNSVFLGSHVVSGTAKVFAVTTGKATEFGKLSTHLQMPAPQTAFQEGIKQFSNFLMLVTLVLTVAIFAINIVLDGPVIVSFVFALALAVGLTPQLLPAIISINLAHGANQMAKKKVIVKKLTSIESFGSMNILCVDKTGTLCNGCSGKPE
jgi:Mg2+-importing ATPase